MSDTLKPCPFCGEPAAVFTHSGLGGYIVRCSNDGDDCAAGRIYMTAAAAAEAWNTRAAQPAEPTPLERLEAWLLTHVAELGIATLIADTAGFGVHLTNPERRVKMVFAPTLAAAIDAALEQAQEGKP